MIMQALCLCKVTDFRGCTRTPTRASPSAPGGNVGQNRVGRVESWLQNLDTLPEHMPDGDGNERSAAHWWNESVLCFCPCTDVCPDTLQ